MLLSVSLSLSVSLCLSLSLSLALLCHVLRSFTCLLVALRVLVGSFSFRSLKRLCLQVLEALDATSSAARAAKGKK